MNSSNKEGFIPFEHPIPESLTEQNAQEYLDLMDKRRSLRLFSDKPISKEVITNLIMTGSTAPSGAHKQPWTFCAISSEILKKEIRAAAEVEEKSNYEKRMSQEWLDDLKPFATNWEKEFLEVAPWIIVVFKRVYEWENGEKKNNYYVNESVGLAAGFLLTAIHQAGLVSLTHTPSPMNFLTRLLDRPENERPYLLIPIGYAEEGADVPDLTRKKVKEVIAFYE